MNKTILIMGLLTLTMIGMANAGICNPVCTLTTSVPGDHEEGVNFNTQWTFSYTNNHGCRTAGTGIQWRNPGGAWAYMSTDDTSNLSTTAYSNPNNFVLCRFGICGTLTFTSRGVIIGENYEIRPACTSGGETNYGSSFTVDVIAETTAPTGTIVKPANGLKDSNGNITVIGNCTDDWSGIDTIELWHNASGKWHLNQSNSTGGDYVEGGPWSVNVTNIINGTTFNYSINCSDINGNYGASDNWYIVSNHTSTPVITTLLTPANTSSQESENISVTCTSTAKAKIDYLELWTNTTGTWHLNQTVNTGFDNEDTDDDFVQSGHVWASDGTYYQDQMKFSTFEMPEGFTSIVSAELCMNLDGGPSSSDFQLTTWRIDDQSWDAISITTGDYNSQSLTNESTSNATLEEKDGYDFDCFDITDAYITTLTEEEDYMTIRIEDPTNDMGSATSLNYFDSDAHAGNSSNNIEWAYLSTFYGEDRIPYIRATYLSELEATSTFELESLPDGDNIWNCKGYDQDSPANNALATTNWSFTIGETEGVCTPPSVGDWHVTERCTLEDEEVNMTGRNLYVYGNGSLTIVNSNFTYSNESIAGNLSVDPLSTRIRI